MLSSVLYLLLLFSSPNLSNQEVKEELYQNSYSYQSKKKDVIQKLDLNYKDESIIEFKLKIITEDCQKEISCSASANLNQDFEIDEDESGEAYVAVEYRVDKDDYSLSIRISEDKQKVKIIYTSQIDGKEQCTFLSNILMIAE